MVELLEYQKRAVDFCLSRSRAIVSADTGSGKTLVGLYIAKSFLDKGIRPIYVVASKSALSSWEREIKKHSDFKHSLNAFDSSCDLNLFSTSFAKDYFSSGLVSSDVLLIDEAHFLCSEDSDLARVFRESILPRFKYIYVFTATPLINRIAGLYFLVNSIFPNYFRSLSWFYSRYTERRLKRVRVRGGFRDVWEVVSYRNLDDLKKQLDSIIFRYVMDYDIRIFSNFIDLSSEEWEIYDTAAEGILRSWEYREFAARLPDLQRVVNGSLSLDGHLVESGRLSSKEGFVKNVLEEIARSGSGCLVFSEFLSSLDRFKLIYKDLPFKNIFYISGESSLEERSDVVRLLGPNDCVFLTSATGGISLNLQAVNNVIFFDIPWSIGRVVQCMGRVARVDSKFSFFNIMFPICRGTIDEYKFRLLKKNLSLFKMLLSGLSFFDTVGEDRREEIMALRRELLWRVKKRSSRVVGGRVTNVL